MSKRKTDYLDVLKETDSSAQIIFRLKTRLHSNATFAMLYLVLYECFSNHKAIQFTTKHIAEHTALKGTPLTNRTCIWEYLDELRAIGFVDYNKTNKKWHFIYTDIFFAEELLDIAYATAKQYKKGVKQ